jgi:glycosyltransferase involved in cell wall biosynthesis
MDMRDPFIKQSTPKINAIQLRKLAKRIAEKADHFTGVNDSCVSIFRKHGRDKDISLITNGYDREEYIYEECNDKTDLLRILYTGTIFPAPDYYNFRPLFRAIAEFIKEGLMAADKIRVEYAGNEYHLLYEMAKSYSMQSICLNHGYVSRDIAMRLQSESSLLLSVSWYYKGETESGVGGKTYEYLLRNKPILVLVAGNLKDSKFKEVIAKANCGFTYEEANDEADFSKMKNFILSHYHAIINNQPIEFKPNTEYIESFDWWNLAARFADIIEEKQK